MKLKERLYTELYYNDCISNYGIKERVNNIIDITKYDLKDLLQYISSGFIIGDEGFWSEEKGDIITIDEIINDWSNEREHK